MNAEEDPRTSLAQERTDLAFHRNRWAAERTLMAWIRTSIAMVTCGFAFDRMLEYISRGDLSSASDVTQRWFGGLLIVSGLLLLATAVIEHLLILRKLRRRESLVGSPVSLPLIGATIVLLIGVAALWMIQFVPRPMVP